MRSLLGDPLPAGDVERVDSLVGFAALRDAWDGLLSASSSDGFFLTWEWLYTWWRHVAGRRLLHIMAIRDGSGLTAVAPLAKRPPSLRYLTPFSVLEFLGTGTAGSDYLDVIIRRDQEADALEVLVNALGRSKVPIELGRAAQGTSSWALASRLAAGGWSASNRAVDICPVVNLAVASWESYLAGLSAAHRYNFRRRFRQLDTRFNMRFDLVHTEAERREALEALVTLHGRRWRTRGGSETFSTPTLLAFHDEISRLALERGWLRLFVLRLNSAPAAILYGYRYGRTFYFYQSAFDLAFAKFSVGLVAMGLAIRHALEEGAAEFDMLHGAEPYKFHWARSARTLDHLALFPPGVRGAMYGRLAGAGGAIRRSARHLVGDTIADRIVNGGWNGTRTARWAQQYALARGGHRERPATTEAR